MRTLSRRLLLLEQLDRGARAPEVRVLYDEEVTSCDLHAGCSVEKVTGRHLELVLKLSWSQVRP